MAKLNSHEEKILKDVALWKSAQPGFLSKVTNTVSKPLTWLGENIIPDEAKSKMGDVTEKIVDKLQDVSQWSVDEEDVLKATKEFEIDSETILHLRKASIFDLDHVSQDFIKSNSQIAMAQGFGTGLLGWAGLIADLPALFTLSFRTIYQISLTYGFKVDSEDKEEEAWEVEYMLRVFRIATSSELSEKVSGLTELKNFEHDALDRSSAALGNDFTRKQMGKTAAIHVSRMLINQIVKQTIARKAITSIPGIGAILTAGFNYQYVQDVGNAAFHLYRERFLLDKKGRRKTVNVTID